MKLPLLAGIDSQKLPSVQELPVQSAICTTEARIEDDEVCFSVDVCALLPSRSLFDFVAQPCVFCA